MEGGEGGKGREGGEGGGEGIDIRSLNRSYMYMLSVQESMDMCIING